MSGDSEEYDDPDVDSWEEWLDEAWTDFDDVRSAGNSGGGGGGGAGGGAQGGSAAGGGGAAGGTGGDGQKATGNPTSMRVRGEVEWAGTKVRSNNGVRWLNADRLKLAGVRTALNTARKVKGDVARAGRSYRAKGWHAQLSELTRNPRGHSATDRADLTVTVETLRKWLSGGGDPNPANQGKISAAYREMRDQVVGEARTKSLAANHALADAVSAALEERYGAQIRVRDITDLQLD